MDSYNNRVKYNVYIIYILYYIGGYNYLAPDARVRNNFKIILD